MSRPGRIALVCLFRLIWLLWAPPMAPAAAGPEAAPGSAARIIVADVFVPAGRPAIIRARVERATLLKQAGGGEPVAFRVDGRPVGAALTGGDGVAVHELAGLTPGLHTVRVSLKSRRYRAEAVSALVAAWPPAEPLLLIHLEGTIIIQPATPLLRRLPRPLLPDRPDRPVDWQAAPQSADVLRRLNRTVHLVFFTTQAEGRLPEIKAWLARHRLPRAPVVAWPGDAGGLAGRIEEVQSDGWTGLTAAVGSSAADATAFLEQGLKAIVLQQDDGEEELPAGAVEVEGWREVARRLRGGSR